ncbi:hypothetical protein TPR58_21360 [Sphingomonas sp. HF-S3]|uniref:Uncharacterized protein n=1 Tax=Sphingomonas rustica TaxID=3103142 RepID=A0ABV0BFZ0_9SPHN
MTTDANLYMTLAASGLAGLGMITAAGLSGWRSWLSLKRDELHERHAADASASGAPSAGSRIEIADLKERLRKLEAIAAGVDL